MIAAHARNPEHGHGDGKRNQAALDRRKPMPSKAWGPVIRCQGR